MMKRRLSLRIAIIAVVMCITASAQGQERVTVESPEDLLAFFERLDYTPEAWQAGIRTIPRIYVQAVGDRWRVNSRNIEVIRKKRIFFRALGPLVLRANELILADRARLLGIKNNGAGSSGDPGWLRRLAERYRVDGDPRDDADAMATLLRRVDVVPPSLALAQGAEESGWGTSRFAAEGNALFGQWTWGGEGIRPKGQRKALGEYSIAAFNTPLESVQAYMHNINTHAAYRDLRDRRAAMRSKGEAVSGWRLAEALTRYSERGPAYVDSLHAIMRVNRLRATDNATLADGPVWHVYPSAR